MTNIDVILKELKDLRRTVATKDDLKNFATKDDLKNFPTKDDLKNELKRFATKDDLKREISGVINYMDDFFVRDQKLEYVKKTISNHEARLLVLEQK